MTTRPTTLTRRAFLTAPIAALAVPTPEATTGVPVVVFYQAADGTIRERLELAFRRDP